LFLDLHATIRGELGEGFFALLRRHLLELFDLLAGNRAGNLLADLPGGRPGDLGRRSGGPGKGFVLAALSRRQSTEQEQQDRAMEQRGHSYKARAIGPTGVSISMSSSACWTCWRSILSDATVVEGAF